MNPVTAAHLHLALCHIPVLALLFGAGWLAAGLLRANDTLTRAAMVTLAVGGVLAIPLYTTGEPASAVVKGLPGFSDTALERHQAAAGITLAGAMLAGLASGVALVLFRARPIPRGFAAALLATAIAATGLNLWTCNLGGQIRHSEIHAADNPAD
jgi:hypothetical protein